MRLLCFDVWKLWWNRVSKILANITFVSNVKLTKVLTALCLWTINIEYRINEISCWRQFYNKSPDFIYVYRHTIQFKPPCHVECCHLPPFFIQKPILARRDERKGMKQVSRLFPSIWSGYDPQGNFYFNKTRKICNREKKRGKK